MEETPVDLTIRVILVGDSNTGKTSLLMRFVESKFDAKYRATIGIDFRTKFLTFGNTVVKVQIFDTAGQERFHTITQAYYRNADGALIVYDVTNPTSFRNIYRWLTDLDSHAASAVKIIIGNKCDKEDDRCVTASEARRFAEEVNLPHADVSALSGANVEEAFMSTVRTILQRRGMLPGEKLTSGQVSPRAATLSRARANTTVIKQRESFHSRARSSSSLPSITAGQKSPSAAQRRTTSTVKLGGTKEEPTKTKSGGLCCS